MPRSEWIDEMLSRELSLMRDRGEGQHLEFMGSYPKNGHELSKEIAAFASSNPGTILIGVADDGSLVGLANVDTSKGRDLLCRRIEGVCHGNVRPAITPVIKFARDENAIVLAIEVPRGGQPIYYSKHTPYVRHLSQSRPAEPHEVIERVSEWKSNPLGSTEEDSGDQFTSELAAVLIEILIDGGEFEDRNVNPWLDRVRTQLSAAAVDLRQLAAADQAVESGLNERLRLLAEKLDSAATHRLTISSDSWNVLAGYVADAVDQAAQLKADVIDIVPLSSQARNDIVDPVRRSARELADLDSRGKAMAEDGRVEELQEEASRIGRVLLKVAHYSFAESGSPVVAGIQKIGRELHLLETERLYMDGGRSLRRIVKQVHDLNGRFQTLLSVHPL